MRPLLCVAVVVAVMAQVSTAGLLGCGKSKKAARRDVFAPLPRSALSTATDSLASSSQSLARVHEAAPQRPLENCQNDSPGFAFGCNRLDDIRISTITEQQWRCQVCQETFQVAGATVFENGMVDGEVLDLCSKDTCLATVQGVPVQHTSSPLKEPVWPEGRQLDRSDVMGILEWLRTGQRISFELLQKIVVEVTAVLAQEQNVMKIDIAPEENLTVCGDIHGQYYDLLNIWEMNGYPSRQRRYLFNGDFVDRGQYSIECILSLFAWKLLDRDAIFLVRGNHETVDTNIWCGFYHEIERKYRRRCEEVIALFSNAFDHLPLAALISGDPAQPKVFVAHGGLPHKDVAIEDLQSIIRTDPVIGVAKHLLWADPRATTGFHRSTNRPYFAPEITERFARRNDVQLIVRSHEYAQNGYWKTHGDRVITVFSAPLYMAKTTNQGAFLHLDHDLNVTVCRFGKVIRVKQEEDFVDALTD